MHNSFVDEILEKIFVEGSRELSKGRKKGDSDFIDWNNSMQLIKRQGKGYFNQNQGYRNRYIITFMLNQIFMFSNKVKLIAC